MLTKKVASDLLDAAPGHLYVALDGHDDESFEKSAGFPTPTTIETAPAQFLQEKERRGEKNSKSPCR